MWDRISVKQRGKAAFQRNYWTCVLAALILALCIGGNAGRSAVNTSQEYLEDDPYEYQYSYAQPGNGSIISTALIGGGISGILIKVLLLNPLAVGGYKFFLKNTREKAEISEFGYAFKEGRWANTVKVMLVNDIYIFLWTLLFIIPGIIKSYSYRMVPYILIENPDIAPNEAIARSRDMMHGHKGATFVLDLSFIGWVLLGVISLGIAIILYESPYYYSTHAEQYRTMTEVTYDRNDYYGETY